VQIAAAVGSCRSYKHLCNMQHSQVEESDVEPGEEDASENGEDFPADREAAVEFGWEDKRPLTGRRLKAAKDKQKKAKSGSFGERIL